MCPLLFFQTEEEGVRGNGGFNLISFLTAMLKPLIFNGVLSRVAY